MESLAHALDTIHEESNALFTKYANMMHAANEQLREFCSDYGLTLSVSYSGSFLGMDPEDDLEFEAKVHYEQADFYVGIWFYQDRATITVVCGEGQRGRTRLEACVKYTTFQDTHGNHPFATKDTFLRFMCELAGVECATADAWLLAVQRKYMPET